MFDVVASILFHPLLLHPTLAVSIRRPVILFVLLFLLHLTLPLFLLFPTLTHFL